MLKRVLKGLLVTMVVLSLLKITNELDWSWWVILSPLWISVILTFLIVIWILTVIFYIKR